MGILLDEDSRIMVQGITGREGSFHARACLAYGTKVVAGVTRAGGARSLTTWSRCSTRLTRRWSRPG